jgi:hypothetical protein
VVEEKIKIKNFKIEAEKGFRRTLFEPELVDPNVEINFVKDSEGSGRDTRGKFIFESQFTEREII